MKATQFLRVLLALSLPLTCADAAPHAAPFRAQDRALTANWRTTPQAEPMFHGFDRAWERESRDAEGFSDANGS
jgi:hypothetical protein